MAGFASVILFLGFASSFSRVNLCFDFRSQNEYATLDQYEFKKLFKPLYFTYLDAVGVLIYKPARSNF